jgi:hypothetical protein
MPVDRAIDCRFNWREKLTAGCANAFKYDDQPPRTNCF